MIPDSTHLLDRLPPVSYVARLTRSDIEEILQEWQARLNLSHWRIKIDWDREPTDEAEAEFDASEYYDEATIMIAKGFAEWERREANVTVVHELVHLVLRDLCTSVVSLKPRVPKGIWDAWADGWFQTANERAVEHLAQVIVDLGGVV